MRPAHLLLFLPLAVLWLAAPAAACADDERRFVLVWDNARLHLFPDDGSRWTHLAAWDDAERPDRTGQVQVMELVADHGSFVQVANLRYLDGTCANYGVQPVAQGYRLELYVRKVDLAPLLQGRFEITYDDGSGVVLDPGVALRPGSCEGGNCDVLARVDGTLLDLRIPEAHLGTWYSPGDPRMIDDWTGDTLVAWAPIHLDGKPVERLPGHHTLLEVRGKEPHPLGALVTLQGGCGDYRVAVAEDAFVDPEMLSGLLKLIGTRGESVVEAEAQVVRAGAPLEHPDGSPAGRVLDEQVFFDGSLGPLKEDGTNRLCTPLLLGEWLEHSAPEGERTLILCVQPGHVRTETRQREFDINAILHPPALEDLDELLRNMPGVGVAGPNGGESEAGEEGK